MNPLSFPLLADENIHPGVVIFLRKSGRDVQTLLDQQLSVESDREVLRYAYESNRVVITHDSDFGRLVIAQGEAFIGLIYLRPGHILPDFTVSTLRAIEGKMIEVTPPFIIVAERVGDTVKIRTRQF